jgi:hypothetical protein
MLFNWWKKKSRRPGEEWPQFTDSLTGPMMSSAQPQVRSQPQLVLDDSRFSPRAEEDIIAAARLVY